MKWIAYQCHIIFNRDAYEHLFLSSYLCFPKVLFITGRTAIFHQIEPSAEVTASIEGYVSAWFIRGGVYGDGTLVRVGLPVTLSYQAARSSGSQWCVNLSTRLTALKLSGRLFYQWRHWWKWGTRHTIYQFGKWDAIVRDWEELDRCR